MAFRSTAAIVALAISSVVIEPSVISPNVPPDTEPAARVTTPVLLIVASPLIDTAVATLEALPTRICAELSALVVLSTAGAQLVPLNFITYRSISTHRDCGGNIGNITYENLC